MPKPLFSFKSLKKDFTVWNMVLVLQYLFELSRNTFLLLTSVYIPIIFVRDFVEYCETTKIKLHK